MTSMISIRRGGYAAAVLGWLATASIASLSAQHASAQADNSAASLPSAASAGSRLHVELPGAATAVPEPSGIAPTATSELGNPIHAEMGRTARSARKPAASAWPRQRAAFEPPTEKPARPQAAAQDGAQEPAEPGEERAARVHPPPDGLKAPEAVPAPPNVEPPPAEQAVVAPGAEAAAGEIEAADGLQPDRPQAGGTLADDQRAIGEQADDKQAALASGPARAGAIASLAFAPNSAALSGDAESVLRDLVARFSTSDGALRLQLLAYAGGADMSASKARRLSLARALAVRSYLMARGIDDTRMDVRALGNTVLDAPAGAPADRVDIAMIRR